MSLEMYQANIMDHYKQPRNFGELAEATAKGHAANPLCGDELNFWLNVDDLGVIKDVRFTGQGCTISVASASMLSEMLPGKNLTEVRGLTTDDILRMLGVPVNPARMKCATLSLETVQQAIGHH